MRNLITMVTLLTLLGGQPTIAQTEGGVGSSAMPADQIVSLLRAQKNAIDRRANWPPSAARE
jgi:hypothetical protein